MQNVLSPWGSYKNFRYGTVAKDPIRGAVKCYMNSTGYNSVSFSVDYGQEFDYLFLQFYNNYCYPGDQYFLPVMDTWLRWARSIPNGPLIVLGLPAGPQAAGKLHYYFPPDKLAQVYKVLLNAILSMLKILKLVNCYLFDLRLG